MKNIYTDNNPHEKNPSDKKEDVQGAYPAEQPPYGQPVYVQPPYGQPVYYIPVGQPPYGQTGYPVPPVPLTQEQLEAIYRQYGAQFPFPQQQFAQPQNQPEGEASQIDPGTRVLFQSADFDAPSDPRTNFEDDINEETEDIPVKASPKKAEPLKPIPGKSSMADPIEIEEETVSLPSKENAPKKNSFRVEEMEMSTYELNSILLRQGHSTAAYPHHTPDQSKDVPLDFSGTFNIDEDDEDIEDDRINQESTLVGKEARAELLKILLSQRGSTGMILVENEKTGAMYKTPVYYAQWYEPTWPSDTPWCACFLSWGLAQVSDKINEPATQAADGRYLWFANVDRFMRSFKNQDENGNTLATPRNHRWVNYLPQKAEGGNYINTPAPGDIVFIDWDGKQDDPAHVGMVLAVDEEYIYTIEGNSANMVAVRKYALTDKLIMGYGIIDWLPDPQQSD